MIKRNREESPTISRRRHLFRFLAALIGCLVVTAENQRFPACVAADPITSVHSDIEPSRENLIDVILAAVHRDAGITPTSVCDDHSFLRRTSLDLLGRVPTIDEVKRFDESGDRARLIDGMLNSPDFARHWSYLWTTILVGRDESGTVNGQVNRESLRRWLEQQFRDDLPLDQFAFDLISAKGVTTLSGPVNFIVANREDPVTPVSRIFLGVQLDCARCHDHPLDRWTQDDYESMRRFFRPIQLREVSGGIELSDSGVETTSTESLPRFLTGAQPRTTAWRRELALMTVRSQPFARAMANRMWQLLLGRGIVEPVDGLSRSHRPSVPELHQSLADEFVRNGFRMRTLIRTICLSDAYARIAAPGDTTNLAVMVSTFASRPPRPLLPEQLLASYATILGASPPAPEQISRQSVQLMGRFSATSAAADPLDLQRTSQGLLHELSLDVTPEGRDLDAIYLSTLTRSPSRSERTLARDLPASDLIYALLHCNEFVFSY